MSPLSIVSSNFFNKLRIKEELKIDEQSQAELNLYNYYVNLSYTYQERKVRLRYYRAYFYDRTNFVDSNDLAQQKKDYKIDENEFLRLVRLEIKAEDFRYYNRLYESHNGATYKVVYKESNQLHAMKIQKKKTIIYDQNLALVRAERDLLVATDSPYIVDLFCSFQSRSFLFIVHDLMQCNLYELVKQAFFTMTEKQIRFYIAEIALGLDAIHQLGFIHQNLKFRNCLITKDGHCKLADLGRCIGVKERHKKNFYEFPKTEAAKKEFLQKLTEFDELYGFYEDSSDTDFIASNSTAISSEFSYNYTAYEVLEDDEDFKVTDDRYDHRCDWYSLGILMYYMFYKGYPFPKPYDMIKQFRDNKPLYLPELRTLGQVTPESKELFKVLICRAKDRISTINQLAEQDFFKDFDWKDLHNQKAPIIPQIKRLAFKDIPREKPFKEIRKQLLEIKFMHKLFSEFSTRPEFKDTQSEKGNRFDWVFLNYNFRKFSGKIMKKLNAKVLSKFSRSSSDTKLDSK